MRAASFFGVLIVARVIVLVNFGVPLSPWAPIAFLWHDVLVAIFLGALDAASGRGRAAWVLYAGVVAFAALNVPVTLVLSSPLTPAMIRAAGGPLRDSIQHHLTAGNISALLLTGSAGVAFPLLLKRVSLLPHWKSFLAGAAVIVLAGPSATARLDTAGLHRNAFTALMPGVLSRGADDHTPMAQQSPIHWRTSPLESRPPAEDLGHYRGAAAGRNVFLIVLESTAAAYLRVYQAPDDPMPNLTGFASRSIVFDNAYAVYPESIKGLFSTLCSRYPPFETPAEKFAETPCSSVAATLTSAGYETALFHSGRFMYLGMEETIQGRGFSLLEDAGHIGGSFNSSFGVDEASAVRRILAWIDSRPAEKPFFAAYLPIAGHHPYLTPGPGVFGEDTEFSRYRSALHDGDKALGELFDGLQARGLDEKTLFLIYGDHGEAFGQHPLNAGHTMFLYEENMRVPYLIAAPGLIESQIRIDRAVSLIDTVPTLLDLLGLPLETEFEGSSMLDPAVRMALFFTDYSLRWLGLRDSCWKFHHEMDSRRSKLFNLCEDPLERSDLSGSAPERARRYREHVHQWLLSPSLSGTEGN